MQPGDIFVVKISPPRNFCPIVALSQNSLNRHYHKSEISKIENKCKKVKMKIIETFCLFNIAAAQGNSIEGRILKVEEKCGLFMDKALICVPPEVKKSKYTHRLNKVMRDAKWHKVSTT